MRFFLSVLCAIMLQSCASAKSNIVQVNNDAELQDAINTAEAGQTIRMSYGEYGDIFIRNRSFSDDPVIIEGSGSSIQSMFIRDSSGWSLRDMEFGRTGRSSGRHLQIGSSSDISISRVTFRGAQINGNPRDEASTGLQIRFSKRMNIEDTIFNGLARALWIQGSEDIRIHYNRIAYVREGFNFASVRNLEIKGNHFELFFPRFDLGEHPDVIQIWNKNETVGSKNVVILENFMSLGGPRAVQGLLIGCENPNARGSDFLIQRNVYYGSSVHGLSAGCVDGLRFEQNVVVASENADHNRTTVSSDGSMRTGYMPRIRVIQSDGANVVNNILMAHPTGDSKLVQRGNVDIKDSFYRDGLPWEKVLCCKRPSTDNPDLSEFLSSTWMIENHPGVGIHEAFHIGPRPRTIAN